MSEQRFKIVITDLGRAKLASAIANGTVLNLEKMAVGDGAGNSVEPSPTQTGLVREVYRADINYLSPDPANPAYAIAELVIPTSVGGWTVREVGVFDAAGALIAVGNVGETYKPIATEGSTREMVLRVVMEVTNSDAVNLTIDASVVLATRQYVDDKANLVSLIPGGTTGQVLRKRSNQDGQVEWGDAADVTAMVDATEEQQTLSAGQTVVALNTMTTAGVAVYINGTRLYAGVGFTITNETSITLLSAATAGQKLLAVKNAPAEPLDYAVRSQNLADIPNKSAARANLGISDAQLAAVITAALALKEPVGTVLFTTNNANPAIYKGFGTWELYAQGRTIIGINTSDTDFNAADRIGGTKTHTLTVGQLPAHTHNITPQTIFTAPAGGHSHNVPSATLTTNSNGVHKHSYSNTTAKVAVEGGDVSNLTKGNWNYNPAGLWSLSGAESTQNDAGGHTHELSIPASETNSATPHTHSITIPGVISSSVGTGASVNHLPPYIVTYIWRRTA